MSRLRVGALSALVGLLLVAAGVAGAQTLTISTASADARSHFDQGLSTMLDVDFAGARQHLDAAIAADPDFALAYAYRAFVAVPADRAEWGARASQHASSASEGERAFIGAIARLVEGPEGLPTLDAVAARFPDDAYLQYVAGVMHFQNDDFDGAATALERAIAADATKGGFHNILGYVEMERGNHAEAEAHFREYIRLRPDHANPYDSLGEFYLRTGRLDEAQTQLEAALARDPEFDASLNNLAWVHIERSNRAYEAAVSRGDAAAIAQLHTPGGVMMPPNAPAISGRSAITSFWEGGLQSGGVTLDFETEEVVARGDMAYERGSYTFSAGGESESGKYLAVWFRGADGTWRMHRDIWNSNSE